MLGPIGYGVVLEAKTEGSKGLAPIDRPSHYSVTSSGRYPGVPDDADSEFDEGRGGA